jgi:8-oxo-dGTP diphosphatase
MHCQRCGQLIESREVDGRTRPVCPSCGMVAYLDPRLAVSVVILRDAAERREVLLGRRAAHTRNPGTWSFPAGFVDRGEQVESAAIREVSEETGLSVTLGPLLGVWSESGDSTVLLAWRSEVVEGEATAGDDFTELTWFPVDELPELGFGHDHDVLRRALVSLDLHGRTPCSTVHRGPSTIDS